MADQSNEAIYRPKGRILLSRRSRFHIGELSGFDGGS